MKVEQLSLADYNKIKNIPVVNQDLSASGFTPVASTYYRHTGTTGTYKQGVIYYYDGTEYKALDGSGGGGGISDVKVNGTSVVTDGVANIPSANEGTAGVITNNTQTFRGTKTFNPTTYSNAGVQITTISSNSKIAVIKPYNNDTSYGVTLGGSNSKFNAMHCNSIYAYKDLVTNTMASQNDQSKKINLPSVSGTMMVAPSTWSSGTSGSLTLTASGTYQIYMKVGNNNINFGVVYWDGSTATYGQIAMVSPTTGYYLSISDAGVMTVYNEDFNGHTSTSTTDTIYYRKIGI